MKDLSVIILSYNTKDITLRCLDALLVCLNKNINLSSEVVVIDNASSDGSVEAIGKFIETRKDASINFVFIKNKENVGFVKGNNQGLKASNSRYVLFLNSDAIIENVDFEQIIAFANADQRIGALTVRIDLSSGSIDPASHRGFPTAWNSFCYFLKLEKLLGNFSVVGKIFGGYHLSYLPLDQVHEIDSPTGAFFFVKKEVLDNVGAFDEDYFMYGEDLDLSYRIKCAGYKIIYYPLYRVTHLKYSSGLQTGNKKIKSKTRFHFYDAMKIFYRKHYASRHNFIFNWLIYKAIDIKMKISS